MREVLEVGRCRAAERLSRAPAESAEARISSLLALALSLTCVLAWPTTPAAAQSCHTTSLRPSDEANDGEGSGLGYRVAISSVLATFTRTDVVGEYQGLFVTGTVWHRWFTAELAVPGYRIAQTGSHAYGLGDVALNVRGNVFRSTDQSITVGPELALTLPTGNADDGLGMGHAMLMPGGFVTWQHGPFALIMQLAYGRMLGSVSEHAHHMGPAPIVNPMNHSELTHAVGVSASVHPNLRVTGRLLGAVSLGNFDGAAREIVAPGLQFIAGAFDFALEQQLPIVGEPFVSRTLLSVGAQW